MGSKDGASQFREDVAKFVSFQAALQRAWAGRDEAVEEIGQRLGERVPKTRLAFKSGQLEILVNDLERFVCLLFLRDHALGRTKICANKNCISPYFLQTRRGQKYCSHKCAVLINVQRFREYRKKLKKGKSWKKRKAKKNK